MSDAPENPGSWLFNHCIDPRDIQNVATNIDLTIETHTCDKCRGHGRDYRARHPFVGPDYIIDFHNAVNRRLGKPIIARNTARRYNFGQDHNPSRFLPGIFKCLSNVAIYRDRFVRTDYFLRTTIANMERRFFLTSTDNRIVRAWRNTKNLIGRNPITYTDVQRFIAAFNTELRH
jgi:hypothetical protein